MSSLEKRFEKWIKSQGLEYMKKGWPDYMVYGQNGTKLFVEVKNPHEQLKPHQIKMHRLLKEVGLKVKLATPKNNGFELKESSLIEFDQEDLKIVEGLLNYKRLQDKLQGLGSILENWAETHSLAKPKVNVRLGRIWMAIAKDDKKKPYNQPNFYIAFSHRITGSLHVEVGLHFRNVDSIGNFSERAIESLCHHKNNFTDLIKASDKVKDLELFLASGRKYRKVGSLRLSDLEDADFEELRKTYHRHKDVRVIFAKVYRPEEAIALKDKFSDEITQTFESLYKIFDFPKVS